MPGVGAAGLGAVPGADREPLLPWQREEQPSRRQSAHRTPPRAPARRVTTFMALTSGGDRRTPKAAHQTAGARRRWR